MNNYNADFSCNRHHHHTPFLFIFIIPILLLVFYKTDVQFYWFLAGIFLIFILFNISSYKSMYYYKKKYSDSKISESYIVNTKLQYNDKSVSYCNNCGLKLDEDSKFCQNCGTKLDKDSKF